MRTYVLYHANCADGFAAAFAYHLFRGDAETTYHPCSYGDALPAIEDGSAVWLLDFSAPREVLDALAPRCAVLQVLDHHATAARELKGASYLVYRPERSGAVIAWEYFRWDESQAVPELFRYIEDRDLWKWQLRRSREINAALATYTRDFGIWKQLMTYVAELNAEGVVALRMIQQQAALAAKHAWLGQLGGYTVPICNCTAFVSETCHEMLQQHPDAPFVAAYRDYEGKRVWSLRSRPDFACNAVAEQFGGGGHAQAAAFEEELKSVHGNFENGGCIAITEERARQQLVEGYTAEKDDARAPTELSSAARAYALTADRIACGFPNLAREVQPLWPLKDSAWKPAEDVRRNLVKAGALLAAEIDRIDRAAGNDLARSREDTKGEA